MATGDRITQRASKRAAKGKKPTKRQVKAQISADLKAKATAKYVPSPTAIQMGQAHTGNKKKYGGAVRGGGLPGGAN